MDEITDIAVAEAKLLEKCGFHGIIVENMHDAPYVLKSVGPEITVGLVLRD